METTYKCKLCNYSTTNKYTFNKHTYNREHLYREELNKYCVLCNKTFKTKQIYSQHRKKYHIDNKLIINKNDIDSTIGSLIFVLLVLSSMSFISNVRLIISFIILFTY